MRVRTAVANTDYKAFFDLLATAPMMSGFLMNLVAPKMRFLGLKQIVKSYKPHVEKNFVLTQLGLTEGKKGDGYLRACHAVVKEGRVVIDKDSLGKLAPEETVEGNLI